MIDIQIKALRELGICLYDRHGEMKPLPILIKEIEKAYYEIQSEKEVKENESIKGFSIDISEEAFYVRDRIIKDGLDELRHIEPEGMEKIVQILKEYQSKNELLTIHLEDEHTVPKVFYKGEELIGKTNVRFEWITQGEHSGVGGVDFEVGYHDREIESVCVIGRKSGEFM